MLTFEEQFSMMLSWVNKNKKHWLDCGNNFWNCVAHMLGILSTDYPDYSPIVLLYIDRLEMEYKKAKKAKEAKNKRR